MAKFKMAIINSENEILTTPKVIEDKKKTNKSN